MKSRVPQLVIGILVLLALFVGPSIFATEQFSIPAIESNAMALSDWPMYVDPEQGVAFQYPEGWTVTTEQWVQGTVLRVSPPDAESRRSQKEIHVAFGIRISSFQTYPTMPSLPYPAILSPDPEQYIRQHLEQIRRSNSYTFESAEFKTLTGQRVLLVYDIGHKNGSLIAFKSVGTSLFQIEVESDIPDLGLSDAVTFFGLAASLQESTDPQSRALVR